jgi:uncharacterized protein (DUF58 family)
MELLRRLSRTMLRLLAWPLQALSRLTSDGGLFLLLVAVCGLLSIGSNSWSNIPLLMCLVMLSLWLLSMWQGNRALKNIHFKRTHVERVFANEPLNVVLQVSNASRLPCAGLLLSEKLETERTGAAQSGKPAEIVSTRAGAAAVAAQSTSFVTVISGKAQEQARYSITVRRRGIYRFGETVMETVFPLGFFNSQSVRHAPGRLVVYPRLGEVDTTFFEELELALRYVRCSRPSRAEEDFRGLREYRNGDNPKWIHWRSTARTQRMLVKEFEEPQAKRVLVLLDTNLQRMGTQRFGGFELAVSFAGTVARDLARRGYEVECAALQPQGKLLRAVVSRERRNLDVLLEMLAGLRRHDTRTLEDMIDALGRRSLHHVYVMVVGLGTLRGAHNLSWLKTADNVVRVLDTRGGDFRRVFRPPGSGTAKDQFNEEDMLLDNNEEEGDETRAAMAAVAAAGQ